LPTLSLVGASLAPPCFRLHTPLIEPDGRISRFRLSGQLCRDDSVEDVKQWPQSDLFPKEQPSSVLSKKLFDGKIGTPDPEIIQSVIAPTKGDSRAIEIRILWPDGSGPRHRSNISDSGIRKRT
jgi:hypothetical protein